MSHDFPDPRDSLDSFDSRDFSAFPRYLAAKRTVDDRALNRLVWEAFRDCLPADRPLRVLEVGGGIGTMVERLAAWGLSDAPVHYTLLDADPANIAAARERLAAPPPPFQVAFVAADMLTFAASQPPDAPRWDALIAHAVLDLVDLHRALPPLLALLRPGGCFWFTLNFDGDTIFAPELDRAFEDHLMARYHRTMDERRVNGQPAGSSRTGRRLLTLLPRLGAEILAAGASDWVVFPRQGAYPGDEAYFLHSIVATVQRALQDDPAVDAARLAAWAAQRHAQIRAGELVYIAHQLDIAGHV